MFGMTLLASKAQATQLIQSNSISRITATEYRPTRRSIKHYKVSINLTTSKVFLFLLFTRANLPRDPISSGGISPRLSAFLPNRGPAGRRNHREHGRLFLANPLE
jgi:hypothetical protein